MKQIFNPYLPLNEYIPDGEPHVFGDRVYVYGSHDKENGIRRAMGEGIQISGAESVLFELTVVSGTPEFKQISKLVK